MSSLSATRLWVISVLPFEGGFYLLKSSVSPSQMYLEEYITNERYLKIMVIKSRPTIFTIQGRETAGKSKDKRPHTLTGDHP